MNKAIVIGASLSGKTTIIKYLRTNTELLVSEIDEELTVLNNGEFPKDPQYKNEVLFPKVLEKILNSKNIVFFTNTWYFTIKDLQEARAKGFKIIQLSLSLDTLLRRNRERVTEGYDNMEKYLKGMIEYQEMIKTRGMVDYVINGDQSVERIFSKLISVFEN
jgi:guanylate kinase